MGNALDHNYLTLCHVEGHFQFLDPAGFCRRPLFALAMRGISVCLLDRASGRCPASSPIAPSALSGLGRSAGEESRLGFTLLKLPLDDLTKNHEREPQNHEARNEVVQVAPVKGHPPTGARFLIC